METQMEKNAPFFIGLSHLSRKSGVPKSTIKFYLRERLLSRPAKTSMTRAYYTNRHLEELSEIKRLKNEEGMSLDQIRELLTKTAEERTVNFQSSDFQERQHRILREAVGLFSTKGFEKTTIGDVCGAASISKTTFYKHFGDKGELFEQCFRIIVDGLINRASELMEQETDIRGILMQIIVAFFEDFPRFHPLFEQLRVAAVYDPERYAASYNGVLKMILGPIEFALNEAIKKKKIKNVDTTHTALVLFGAVDHVTQAIYTGADESEALAIYEKTLDILLSGIGA